MYREPPGEPDARARRAKELRQVVKRQSRGTPAMQKKTKKEPREPAATVCHPVSRGLKIFYPWQGRHSRCSLTPAYHLSPPSGAPDFGSRYEFFPAI